MATVKHVEHADGSHSIGVDVDGVYNKLATISAASVASNAERHATLSEAAKAGDEGAADALDSSFGGGSKGAKD